MKTGIITGCSRGIGFAITNLLTENLNYKIIGTSTSGTSQIGRAHV